MIQSVVIPLPAEQGDGNRCQDFQRAGNIRSPKRLRSASGKKAFPSGGTQEEILKLLYFYNHRGVF